MLKRLFLVLVGFTFLVTGGVHAAKKVPESRQEVQLSYAPLVKKTAPAVVNVYARRVVRTQGGSPFANDPFFNQFFGRRGFGIPRERVQNSLGSGVIVGEDGVVVTNNHVISGGDEFRVVLADRREYEAELLFKDEQADLAILKIDTGGEKMPVLEFHDSDDAEVGDIVLAIGNPFGVGQTVTSGIISALARSQVGISDFQSFIQTDAAINPGNSGGALVTMDGTLIGVNTAIFSRSGGSNGIGFAIPSNMVRLVVEAALADGELKRPWFGASGQVVTGDIAESLDINKPGGVLLSQVHPGGPADRAGLNVGDVVLSINGFDVNDLQSLRYRIATQTVGNEVEVAFLRNGDAKTTGMRLASPPADPAPDETLLEGRQPLSGATVANLSPAFNEELGFDTMLTGVVVTAVERGGAASRMGFRRGDVLISVEGEEIESVNQLEDIVLDEQRSWTIRFRRGNREQRITVRG